MELQIPIDHTLRLPLETLTRIFLFAAGPFSTLRPSDRTPSISSDKVNPMDFYRTGLAFCHRRNQWRGKRYPRGLHLYEGARVSSAVCRRWRKTVVGSPELYFLMIYPAECNPPGDRMTIERGDSTTEEESDGDLEDDPTPESQAKFEERKAAKIPFFQTEFDRMLAMGDRFPNCDIFICMDECLRFGINQDHMTHFKLAPWYLVRCAPRLRVFTCYLLHRARRTRYFPPIIKTLFGSGSSIETSAVFPRLEHIQFRFDWEAEDYYSAMVDELLKDIDIVDPGPGTSTNLPNLTSLNSFTCPWHYLPLSHLAFHFQHLHHLRLIDLDNVDTIQPSIWQMVNACPNLELLQLTWWAIITMDDWERAVVPFFREEERITVERITSLEIQLYDQMLWPLLGNTFFPRLGWLVITVVGHDTADWVGSSRPVFEDFHVDTEDTSASSSGDESDIKIDEEKEEAAVSSSGDESDSKTDGEEEEVPSSSEDESESKTEREEEEARRRSEGRKRKKEIRYHWPKLKYLQLYPLHRPSAEFLTRSTFDVLETLDISYRWRNEFMRKGFTGMAVFHPRVPYVWIDGKDERLEMPMIRKLIGRTSGMDHVGLLGALNPDLVEFQPRLHPSPTNSGLKEIDVLIDGTSPEASSQEIDVDLSKTNPHIFVHLERITFRFNRYEAPASKEIDISYCLGLINMMDRWYAPKLRCIAFIAERQNPEWDLDLEWEVDDGVDESVEDEDGFERDANETFNENKNEYSDDSDSDEPDNQDDSGSELESEHSQKAGPLRITEDQLERLVAFLESRSEAFAPVERVRFVGIELPDMLPSATIEEWFRPVERLMSAVQYVEVVSGPRG